jgi:hypothetical protein
MMKRGEFKVGDEIEVIDKRYSPEPMRGSILSLDPSILGGDFAEIRVAGAALPPPVIWVSLRLAKNLSVERKKL